MEAKASAHQPLRILAVSALWQGANDYAFVRAFRRAGHSVQVVSEAEYIPRWRSSILRVFRRALMRHCVEDYNRALAEAARQLQPDVFFVFKGPYVKAETIRAIRKMGAAAIQFYPDTGFAVQSSYVKHAITQYDWFFSTKSNFPNRFISELGFHACSFLPHAFDPEVHTPTRLSDSDRQQYGCDVAFIGNISQKKYTTMNAIAGRLSGYNVRVWGAPAWGQAGRETHSIYQGGPVTGIEYAKAIGASKINLGLLFEGNADGEPDTTTARTFEIPAAGGFMLHERTEEAMSFFEDGKECVFFDGHEDLVEKVRYYLAHEDERQAIAAAGRERCLRSGYSVDHRAQTVIDKFHELRAARSVASTDDDRSSVRKASL